MSNDLEYTKPEPQMYDRRGLSAGLKLETEEHIAWRIEKGHYDNFNSITKEKRQEILDLFRKGGITISEVGEKLGIDSRVVSDVIYLNITHVSLLRNDTQ